MKKSAWSLTSKLVATGATFLALALLSIGLTLWISWNLEGGAAAMNEAGRLRMMTYRLALGPEAAAPAERQRMAGEFEAAMELLRTGDPSRPLFVPWSDSTRSRYEEVRDSWARLHGGWLAQDRSRPQALAQADAFVAQVDRFVTAIEDELARWTAVLHVFQFAMLAVAIGCAVALLYAAYLLVLNPVARLKRGLAAVREGDLTVRVEVDTRDEFGELSEGFNDMAEHLHALYEGLEDRVREKTARLEAKRRRLADLYDVSAFTARATQLDELSNGFAAKVRRIAGADAAAVRWSSEENDRYVMLAADNLPPALAQAEGCLDSGSCFCGQTRANATTRVIPIIPATPAPLGHCGKAGFRTVVSVPVMLQDRLLGEVDLFYKQDRTLPADDRELLDTLASHLAGAMEGLRVGALQREAAVAQERSLIARELHDSIAQSLIFLKIQVRLLREATQRGDAQAAAAVIEELDTGVRESYADVRELLLHFRTRTSEESIEPALRTTLSKFEHQTGLRTQLSIDARGLALAPDVQVQVLHIVQEALSNVRKHAGASKVWLDVTSGPWWRFEVRDDGRGFESAGHAPGESHVGLRIMQERAERIGARLGVSARPGAGCVVSLEVPVASPEPTPAALAQAA